MISPAGVSQQVDAGQGLYMGTDGSLRRGNVSQLSSLLGQGPDGKEILKELISLQATTELMQQTVITLASLLPTEDVLAAPAVGTTTTAGTAGSGGGGNVASPN